MLFTENLIDEIVLKINPFVMGSGIPLFGEVIQPTSLELTDSKIYENSVLLVSYQCSIT